METERELSRWRRRLGSAMVAVLPAGALVASGLTLANAPTGSAPWFEAYAGGGFGAGVLLACGTVALCRCRRSGLAGYLLLGNLGALGVLHELSPFGSRVEVATTAAMTPILLLISTLAWSLMWWERLFHWLVPYAAGPPNRRRQRRHSDAVGRAAARGAGPVVTTAPIGEARRPRLIPPQRPGDDVDI